MTQDEIIEMAKKAGIIHPIHVLAHLEDFAKLVEEKVRQELREEIIYTWVPPHFVDLAVKEEREACNAICKDAYEWAMKKLNETKNAKEDSHWAGRVRQAQDIGHAIRARGEA